MTTGSHGTADDLANAPLFALTLIDRRSGLPQRVNGRRVVAFTRMPDQAAAEALAGRDRAHWTVRIECFVSARSGALGGDGHGRRDQILSTGAIRK